MNKMHN